MLETCYLMSSSALTKSCINRAQKFLGTNQPVELLVVSNMLKEGGGVFGLLLKMRKIIGQKLIIVYEDESTECIGSTLKIIAAASRVNNIYILNADQFRPLNRLSIIKDVFGVCSSTFFGWLSILKTYVTVNRLLKAKPMVFENKIEKKCLYLNANLWFGVKAGGSVGHVAGVANALLQEGYELDYASFSQNEMLNKKIRQSLIRLDLHFGVPFDINYYRMNYFILDKLLQLDSPYNFIYQRMSIANFTGVMLSRIKKIPYILEYNGSEVWVSNTWGKRLRFHHLADKIEQVCLRHASLVVTISDVLEQELIARGVPRSKIVTYPNCIEPETFNPARFSKNELLSLRQQYGLDSSHKIIMFVGTFGVWHGVEVLAKAIVVLVQHNRDWLEEHRVKFMLVGDGVKMPVVKQILQEGHAEDFVILTGMVHQKAAPEHLAIADCFVSPHVPNADGSRFFGSPTKLFEYMAMQKPIIASALDQIAEVLTPSLSVGKLDTQQADKLNEENKNSLSLVTIPGSVEELVNGIKFIVEHPVISAALAENARKEVLKKYTWSIHVQKILERAES